MKPPLRILLVDDDPQEKTRLESALAKKFPGVQVDTCGPDKPLDKFLRHENVDIVITESKFSSDDPFHILRKIKKRHPEFPVFMLTSHGSEELAAEAIKSGFDDYFAKSPNSYTRLTSAIAEALDKRNQTPPADHEKLYRDLYERVPVGLFRLSPEGHFIDANPALVNMLGYPDLESLKAITSTQLYLDPQTGAKARELIETDGILRNFETQIRHRDGKIIWIRANAQSVRARKGPALYYDGAVEDITERKMSRESLDRTHQLYREAITKAGAVPYQDLLSENRYAFMGEAIEALTGYRAEELTAELFKSRIHRIELHGSPPDQTPEEHGKRVRAGEDPYWRADYLFEKKDGKLVWLSDNALSILGENEKPIGSLGILTDITERKESEDRLRGVHEIYIRAIENARGVAYRMYFDRDSFDYIAENCLDLLGIPKSELNGPRLRKMVKETVVLDPNAPSDPAEYGAAFRRGEIGSYRADYKIVTDRGLEKWLNDCSIPIRDENSGKVVGALGILSEVTERRGREQEMGALVQVTSALRTVRSRAEMPPVILDQTINLLQADGAALILIGDEPTDLKVELARGSAQPAHGEAARTFDSLSKSVVNDRKPQFRNSEPTPSSSQLSQGCVPLIAQDQIIGVLCAEKKTPFSNNDERLLTTIGEIAANAINRASLHELTELRLMRLGALRSIDTAITGTLDLRVSLSVVLDQIITQLKVDATDLLLYNIQSQMLEYIEGRGFRSSIVSRTRLRLGEGLPAKSVLERRQIHIHQLNESHLHFSRAKLLQEERFVSYIAVPLIAKGEIKGVLEIFNRNRLDPDREWFDFLETLSQQTAIAIDNAELFTNLERSNLELTLAYDTTLEGWSKALDLRDKETEGHTLRVTELTLKLAEATGFSQEELVHVRRGALLHDIGKMGIPDSILLKAGPLNPEEWVVMRMHPTYAYDMLSPITFLRPALDIPYCHHEKWDGTGYPQGLKGEQIPVAARIFATVDIWDALRSDRPYRKAWSEEKVKDHLKSIAGNHLDSTVVELFNDMLNKGLLQGE